MIELWNSSIHFIQSHFIGNLFIENHFNKNHFIENPLIEKMKILIWLTWSYDFDLELTYCDYEISIKSI